MVPCVYCAAVLSPLKLRDMHHLFITPDLRLLDAKGERLDSATFNQVGDTIVWVPSEDITLLEINLPTRNVSDVEQSLPYAIEEELLEDIDTLHIAWNMTPQRVPIPVAVVRKKQMRAWVSLLRSQKISAYQLVPDVFALPLDPQEPSASLWVEPNRSVLRTGVFSGFAATRLAMDRFLRINVLEPKRYEQYHDQPPPTLATETKLSTKKQKKGVPKHAKEAVPPSPQPEAVPDLYLPLHQADNEEFFINLMQGDYVAGVALSRIIRRTMVPLIGVALVVALVSIHQVVQYLVLRKDVSHFQDLVEQRAQTVVPSYTADQPLRVAISEAVVAHREELQKRTEHPWFVFEQAIPMLRNCYNCVFERISVDDSSIWITASSFTPLDSLQNQLRSLQGYQVNVDLTSKLVDESDYYTLSLRLAVDRQQQQQQVQ